MHCRYPEVGRSDPQSSLYQKCTYIHESSSWWIHHSIMERCRWRRSTFYKHYPWPVASGEKPTTTQGVTIDTTTFFFDLQSCLKPGAHVILPPPEYVTQSDIFPCGTSDPTDFELYLASPMEFSLQCYKCKTATETEIVGCWNQKIQDDIKVTQALLSLPPAMESSVPKIPQGD